MRRAHATVAVAAGLVLAACAGSASNGRLTTTQAPCAGEAPSLALMQTLIERFNARDTPGWNATFHFPNVIIANGAIRTVATPQDQADTIPNLVAQGWVRSEWQGLGVLQCSATKAHVGAAFLRYRADGSLLSQTTALYVIEQRNGRWGVTVRSMLPG